MSGAGSPADGHRSPLSLCCRMINNMGSWGFRMRWRALRLYAFALGLGLRLLLRGMIVEGLRILISPVGYWRFLPNAYTYEEFLRFDNPRILDVSSPKLPSVFFATRTSQEVCATDLDDETIFSRWQIVAKAIGLANYRVAYQDARRLSYPD